MAIHIGNIMGALFKNAPEIIQKRIISLLKKVDKSGSNKELISRLQKRIGYRRMKRYATKLFRDFEGVVGRIENKRFVKMDYQLNSKFYHIGILLYVLEGTVLALSKGYIPVFFVNGSRNTQEELSIEWIIKQPCEILFGINADTINRRDYVSEVLSDAPFRFEGKNLWNVGSKEFRIWSSLAKKILNTTERFDEYMTRDVCQNGLGMVEKIGVIVRGTDYTKLRPRLHPIQPNIEDVIKKVRDILDRNPAQKIYVVTDEEQTFAQFEKCFGKENVLTNTRVYYDKVFWDKNCYQICDAHIERENDDYWHSMEYVSSLFILARCSTIVGGNCGGSKLAVLLAEHPENAGIFNLGVY